MGNFGRNFRYMTLRISRYLRQTSLSMSLIVAMVLMVNGAVAADAANGEKLFKQNCAACHKPDKNMVGPALKGAKDRWVANASEELYYEWIKNNQKLIAEKVPYAVQIWEEWNRAGMNLFLSLTNEQIDDITEYVDTYSGDGGGGAVAADAGLVQKEEEGGGRLWLILLIAALVLIPIVAQNFSVIFTLNKLDREKDDEARIAAGRKPKGELTFSGMAKAWAWKNMWGLTVIGLILLFGLLVQTYGFLKDVGVYEGYHPSQPIKFPHYVHAKVNEIHCEYCHNSAYKSKHAGLPTVNVCMNCHKAIEEGGLYGTEEISKIYAAAGWDGQSYTGETKPLVWNRVYVLPDHVYFNHAQHVTVAGLACQNCHGAVEEMETAYLAPVNELLPVDKKFMEKTTYPSNPDYGVVY
jgi:cytochrome c2